MTSKEFVGAENEKAWADFFEGTVIGGMDDKGLDVTTGDEEIPVVQTKNDWFLAERFLYVSFRKHEFIPICVGSPPRYSKETKRQERARVLGIIRLYGGYVDEYVPCRELRLEQIRKVRAACGGT